MTQENFVELIEKINSEDNLLNSRVNIFLVLLGLLLTAFAFEKSAKGEIVFVPLGIFMTVIWFLCTLQSWLTLEALHGYRKKLCTQSDVSKVADKGLLPLLVLHPNTLLAFLLPLGFLIAWMALLFIN